VYNGRSFNKPILISPLFLILNPKTLPDQLRIGTNAPKERVLLARFDFQKNWTARMLRKKSRNNVESREIRLA
jgi:hypothetical protein